MFGLGTKKKPVAQNLTEGQLRLLDFVILVDNSGSMAGASRRVPGKTRTGEVEADVMRIAEEAEKYDSDGITVIAFADSAKTFDGVGAVKVATTFKSFPPMGGTNLAAAIEAAGDKARTSVKNTVIICFTDGEPNSGRDPQGDALRAMDKLGRELGRPKIGFTFVQVGSDPDATRFLDKLDSEMKVDVVATVRADEVDKLSVSQLAWLAQNA